MARMLGADRRPTIARHKIFLIAARDDALHERIVGAATDSWLSRARRASRAGALVTLPQRVG